MGSPGECLKSHLGGRRGAFTNKLVKSVGGASPQKEGKLRLPRPGVQGGAVVSSGGSCAVSDCRISWVTGSWVTVGIARSGELGFAWQWRCEQEKGCSATP